MLELDDTIIERRAAGESLRTLAEELGTNHVRLSRALKRPENAALLAELRRPPPKPRKLPRKAKQGTSGPDSGPQQPAPAPTPAPALDSPAAAGQTGEGTRVTRRRDGSSIEIQGSGPMRIVPLGGSALGSADAEMRARGYVPVSETRRVVLR